MANEVIKSADEIKRWRRLGNRLRLSVLILLFFLIILYLVLKVMFSDSNFVVSLKSNDSL